MGIHARIKTAAGQVLRPGQKIAAGFGGGKAGGKIDIVYFPGAKDEGTKIVFIQVMRELLDGVAKLPSALVPSFGYQDADTTARFFHVDYVPTMKDPYPASIGIGVAGSAFGPYPNLPGTGATFWDDPENHPPFPGGASKMTWEFRTAAFSAAGADAGTYYAYQDWSYEVQSTGAWQSKLGTTGFDPGPDFKDAVKLWAGNHSATFTLPTPPPPQAPPAWKGSMPYRAQSGDTLQKISLRFYGSDIYWTVLYAMNQGITYGGNLDPTPGQVLIIL